MKNDILHTTYDIQDYYKNKQAEHEAFAPYLAVTLAILGILSAIGLIVSAIHNSKF